ncbi:hypothetical protein JMN32_17345 [Fulvivirga sp. 29W222]|uniref:Uncharacterized protein n=1 Tax=Fulvivirga marina TaxID=2494733 RepID=A0A937FZX0_9BACT|nr:hypothetical protein [Fulvivirga marina]MBL6448087.1 hypothetical protein [Fulvivirga marina]
MNWVTSMKVLLALTYTTIYAQDTTEHRLQYSGYVKDLQSLNYTENFAYLTTGNLIHNRINLKWQPAEHITAVMEFRNRLFWGEEVALTPGFSSQLRNANEAADLSFNWIDKEQMVLNTSIDRLYVVYDKVNWNARIGRQRINWGIGTTWNPNDLFNTFNFLDFDYEERPGADAVRLQYFTGLMDNIELAISAGDESYEMIAAMKYFANIANYDFQIIAGWFQQQPTLGVGWSGIIKESGFRGEAQYYFPKNKKEELINISAELDHVFEKGWYVSIGGFLNSKGIESTIELPVIATLQFSPKNLMPTKWNTNITFSKEITPLFTGNATVIYSPGSHLVMILPTLSYNLAENLDFNLVWQSFFSEQKAGFDDLAHRVFIRMRWSF